MVEEFPSVIEIENKRIIKDEDTYKILKAEILSEIKKSFKDKDFSLHINVTKYPSAVVKRIRRERVFCFIASRYVL